MFSVGTLFSQHSIKFHISVSRCRRNMIMMCLFAVGGSRWFDLLAVALLPVIDCRRVSSGRLTPSSTSWTSEPSRTCAGNKQERPYITEVPHKANAVASLFAPSSSAYIKTERGKYWDYLLRWTLCSGNNPETSSQWVWCSLGHHRTIAPGTDGRMDGRVGGWMDGWMDVLLFSNDDMNIKHPSLFSQTWSSILFACCTWKRH